MFFKIGNIFYLLRVLGWFNFWIIKHMACGPPLYSWPGPVKSQVCFKQSRPRLSSIVPSCGEIYYYHVQAELPKYFREYLTFMMWPSWCTLRHSREVWAAWRTINSNLPLIDILSSNSFLPLTQCWVREFTITGAEHAAGVHITAGNTWREFRQWDKELEAAFLLNYTFLKDQ